MSKKVLLPTLAGLVLIVLLVLTNFGRNLPFAGFFTPVYTAEIPESRPVRLDQRLLERFEGAVMEDILAVLASEKAAELPQETGNGAPPGPAPDPLFESLPDAPFPFDEDTSPRDADFLTDFVTSMKREENSTPSREEIWRFNLALSALRITPDKLPASLRLDEAVTPESDTLAVRFESRESPFVPPYAIGNFDDSPGLEILDRGGTRLSTRDGSGGIISRDDHGILFPGSKLYPADFDNDGDTDLFVIRPGGFPNSLYENKGNGRFEDVTIARGLLTFNDTTAATWLDYDGDGRPDLLAGSSDHPLELFHQTTGGTFQPVAWDLKLWVHRGVRELRSADLSGDGFMDFFIGIDGQPDRLLITKPAQAWEDWRFEESPALSALAAGEDLAPEILDFNHDGALDLALFGQNSEGASFFRMLKNEGDGTFTDATGELGFTGGESVTGLGVIDFDQDGYHDLYLGTPETELNRAFWNRSGVAFREVSVTTRSTFLDAPQNLRTGDLDGNGLSELLYETGRGKIRRLEPGGSTSSFLPLSLPKPLPGAKVTATVRDRDWILQSLTYTLGEETSLNLGIGEADLVEELTVRSADGKTTLHQSEKLAPGEPLHISLPEAPTTAE